MSFSRLFGFVFVLILAGLVPDMAQAAETAEDQPPAVEVVRPGPGQVGLIFRRGGGPDMVIRDESELPAPSITTRGISPKFAGAEAIVRALVEGPNEIERVAGYESFLPEGATLAKVDFESTDTIKIYLDLPADFVKSEEYYAFTQIATRHFIENLYDMPFGLSTFYLYARDPDSGEFRGLLELLPGYMDATPDEPVIQAEETGFPKPAETDAEMTPKNLPTQNGEVSGALTGKRIVLNQSHGWYYNKTPLNRWAIQRSLTWQVLEDFASAMFMNQYVIPMLQNAGGMVRPVREPDTQTNMVVIDNAMGAPRYVESGSGWFNSALNGYVHKTKWTGLTDNPFGNAGATRLVPGTTGASTASATFTPTFTRSGYYNVYISYAAGTDRTTNAHFRVYHSGGSTDFRVDQTKTGASWVLLGNFYFEQGAPASEARVVAYNDSGDTRYLNVDAVRFGGGMGDVARHTTSVSGRPRWQEDATIYLAYSGMLNYGSFLNTASSTDERLGWTNRPRAARWEQSRANIGNDLVYIGWHTNASTWSCSNGVETEGAGRGTLVIRDVDGDATAATKNLTLRVRDGMMASVRASYDSSWPIRGGSDGDGIAKSNSYGEANQAHLGNNVAGFFFEGVFHDNRRDAAAYKDGKFRYAAARGIVNGLIRYYGGTTYPPEPVRSFRVQNIGNNQVRLSWTRGPVGNANNYIGSTATGFRVFESSNGYGFDNGTNTGNTLSYTMSLAPGELRYVRVSAVNSAGISVPSETLAVQVPADGLPTVLVVNGYHRDDQFISPMVRGTNLGGCTAPTNQYREMDPRKYNSLNYTIQHAEAIDSKGNYGIDSCSNEAIHSGALTLGSYPMVFWIGGQQAEADLQDSVDDTSLRPGERSAISNYLENGGKLFISGSEIAWDLGRAAASTDKRNFFQTYLKANYVSDDSGVYSARGTSGVFAGLGAFSYDNGTGETYDVRFPDVLGAREGSVVSMAYGAGSSGAAIEYSGIIGGGTSPAKLVYMGFGFETVTSENVRNNIMDRVIDFFSDSHVDDWNVYHAATD